MAGNYKVEDILAEIERKKSGAAPRPAAPSKPAAQQPSPFGMRDIDDDPPPAPKASSPFARAASEATRTDLPAAKSEGGRPKVSESTKVMPAIKDESAAFEQSRQKKVKDFMQNSFAAEGSRPAPRQDDDEIDGLSQHFRGLQRSGEYDHGDRPKKSGKPAKPAAQKASGGDAPKKKKSSAPKKEKDPKQPPQAKKSLKPLKKDKASAIAAAKKREEEEDGEYMSPSDARDVRDDISAIMRSLKIRAALTGVCTLLLLYLALANLFPLPLLTVICPETDMKIFMMVNLMVLVISALAANAVIGNGLVSFFKFKADYDAPAAICTLAVIAHGVALIMNPEAIGLFEGGFYFVIASASLFANSIGKLLMITRIKKNFVVASASKGLRGEYVVDSGELASRLAQGQGFAEPTVAYSTPIGFPENFLKLSYSDEYAENLSRYTSHFFVAAALILALTCRFFFDSSTMQAFAAFTAVLCMASPLSATIVGNLPLLRAANKLTPDGAFISGYDAVETFEEMNCVIVKASELYPKSQVELHGIKPLAESRIDEAIIDAVSVCCRIDGLLSDALLAMINGDRTMLLPVDEVQYHTGAGVRASVDGKTVLIGRRSLMESYGVAIPPPEYEKKFAKGGKKVLFIANSGAVTAMLIVSYRPSKKAAPWVNMLGRKELGLIVFTANPNITAKKVSSDFRYPGEFIRILPAELYDSCAALTSFQERGPAYIVSPVEGEARLRALASVHTIRRSIMTGSVLQLGGLIIGYALTAFMAFSGAIASLGFGQIAIYQLACAALAVVLSNLKKL